MADPGLIQLDATLTEQSCAVGQINILHITEIVFIKSAQRLEQIATDQKRGATRTEDFSIWGRIDVRAISRAIGKTCHVINVTCAIQHTGCAVSELSATKQPDSRIPSDGGLQLSDQIWFRICIGIKQEEPFRIGAPRQKIITCCEPNVGFTFDKLNPRPYHL